MDSSSKERKDHGKIPGSETSSPVLLSHMRLLSTQNVALSGCDSTKKRVQNSSLMIFIYWLHFEVIILSNKLNKMGVLGGGQLAKSWEALARNK